MSASWDSDLSSIIEKTNNNLKLLRKIGDKPQVRSPDVSVTAAGHPSARPRAFVGAQEDAGSTSSRGSARPRAFIRGDDDTSSMGSRGSARPKAYVRGDDDTGSMGSHTSARPKAFIRADDDSGSVSSRASARPKAFIRPDDDVGSASSRASARPKAFIRADDDSGSVSSRASARPKAFIRGDDDTGSMSSRSSARPKAFVRGDDDTGSMNSSQGIGRSRLDSGSSSGRPHVGIAGGGGLTAAMLQQHRATATGGTGLGMADLGAQRSRFDLDETRSMSGVSASRLRRPLGANGRVPHARGLGASMGPRIRVPDADIPSDAPNHMVDEIKKSLETHFASRNGAVDKKVADLRTDVAGLTTQTSSLSSQISELRDAVLVSANSSPSINAPSASDPKIFASVQANAAAIARLEEHSADLLGRKVSVDRELTELGSRVKALSSATMKIPTLEDNVEALVANRQKQEQGLFKLADRVQLMHRQMGSLVDMKAVENLLSIRLTREFREMEDRLAQNVVRMAEKMELKVQSMEKQSFSQRQESLAALKSDLTDDIQRLQSSALRKSDLLPLQNAQTQSKEDVAQLSSALDRQEKKLQDAKLANAALRDELADARTELNKALQSQQRSTSALMEEKLEQITTKSKEKSSKVDDQLSELAKKQKKLEEATKTLQETMTQVKAEAGQRWSRSSADREEENDKLRQRLARSVAELEALATTKAEVERRFTSEEQNFQSRLKELRVTLTDTEKQKEAQRLELMQKLQEESKLMGVAQGKNSLLETLLAREKAENEEKNELVRKSKKEVTEVREQIRNLESEKEKKVRQLTSELQAKQTQVGLLTKTLKRIETASAKLLDLSKREAKTVRRVKATKEHELFIAQLKLKEMERVAQALQNGDEMKKQAALTAASTEERKELEKLLLESQLEKDELKQELEEMTEEFNAAKESQKVIMEDTITKLSSDYDDKISELKQQIADKEQAMRQLRDTLVEKSNLDALEDELAALRDEKNDLLEQIQRAQIEHERVTLKTETNLRLEHATEFAAMKAKFEERILELEGAKSELEKTKTTVAELEKELKEQEALHQREVATRTDEIKEARSKIDECTAQILDLEETKARLEGDVSQMEANIGGASAEQEEELEAIKSQMQTEVEKLRAELALVSSTLEEKQTQLREAKLSDEFNRQRLVEMAMAQEEMQSRYVSQIDSLTLKLNQERENSRAREQDLEDTIDKLNADVKTLKTESSKELEAARSELTDQMTELTATLKASQHREQQLQSRLKRILEELVQAANASGESEVAQDAEMSDDEAITHHLDALYATHRRTAHELDRLQAEYELTVKQAAADSATAQELDNQVKEHETQINELESVVEQLREELKEQYHKSAVIAKGSDEFSDEMATLREEKRQLERQLQEEERDREKREVSYQRRTEMKEREVEELRNENKTLTAAVAAVREKIRAVENVKFNDLGSLQNKLKDLEERTAALQLDEKSVANLEQDFTATRHEIVTLTAEVQSLYQKLTACCGIVEWSELRASVFDEEEKLTRVRSENARELAKVESVEQEVLTNAEFLNALLVAHGSTGGDGDLLNDFRWMQKYASIAPEIVEKLRTVETRLRDAVLDDSTWLFQGASKVPEGAARPPKSQKSAVDGAAIALALEKAREDYFSETSDGADEELQHDVDQPDVEQEGLAAQEGEGASLAHVDVEDQGSIGALSHDDSGGTCAADDLVVAEHVVHDEQDRSREKHFDDEELSVTSEQDRIDEDGLESRVDRKTDETTNARIEAGFSGDGEDDDDMAEEVERRVLEHSSKQVNPRIDNECDDSDEFATTIVHVETEEQSAADAEEADELDPLEESSFDNAVIAALESREAYSTPDLISSRTNQRCEVEADSEAYVAQDAITESSFDESMLSDNDEANCDDVHQVGSYSALPSERVFQSNNSFLSMESGAEVVEGSSPNIGQLEQDNGVEASSASRNPAGQLAEELGELKESATSKELEKSAREHEEESAPDEARGDEDHVVTELSSTVRRIPLGDFDGKSWKNAETKPSHHVDNALDELSASGDRDVLVERSREGNELEQSPHDSEDDGIHTDRREAVVFRSDILESSFDPDVQSDFNDEASAELSTLPIKRQDEAEDEWSQEQLRVAEHSLDGALVPEDDEKAATGTLASDPAPPLALSIEDDENSVEETMAAQTQPIASLNRFGMGSRRFNLEEDDEMDEIERLLLDQMTSSEKSQMRSKDDNEFEEDLAIDESDSNTLADQHDEDSAAAELPTTGRRSELSESCDEANTKNISASSFEGVETKRLHEEHATIRSEIELDQSAASIASAESEESTPSAGNNTAAASSYAQYSEASLERASRHTNDDTLAFQSADDDTEPNPLENSFDEGMQSDGASPIARRLEEGDSSEEETMAVQTQLTFSASLSRFGTGSRRSNLEEDDEMDEIERLLLDQSASSMQKRQQQPGRSSTMDDDDEFGESSLQSRGEESDEFGEESMRSKDDNEFVDVSKRSGDDTVDVLSAHDKQLLPSSLTRRRLTEEYEGNEVSEELTSAMRRTPSEESAASLKNVEHEPPHEDNELEQSAASIASGDYAEELEESASSVQSTTQRYKGKNCNISVARADTEQLDASNSFDNDAATDDLYTYATDPLQGSALSVDNDGSDLEESSSSLASGSRGEDAPARATLDDASYTNRDAVVESRPDPLESSFDADVEPDGDDEARASYDTEIATQPTKHREEADDKWSDEQLRHAHPPGRFMAGEEESDVDDNEPARTPAMTLRMEEDESSEETRPVQTQPTFSASLTRLGMSSRRLNLEEDDEMDEIERLLLDQRASSRQKRQQQPRPGARDDEGEFGESSVQSRDDEEDAIGGDSIRSHEDDNECGGVLTRPRGNEFDARSIQHDEEIGRQHGDQVTGGTRHQVSDDDDEVGEDDALEASPARFDEGAIAASFDEDTELELAAAGIPSSHQAEEITTFKESTSSMRSGDQHVTHGNALQDSAARMDTIELAHGEATKPSVEDSVSDVEKDTGLHTDGVEHATSSFDTTAVAFEEDEGNASEASSSCLASEARDNYSRSSTGRTSDIQPHDSEDDGIHTDRREAVVSRSDILESSFDPDVQSDFNDEASAELSTLPIKRQDEAEDEWSQEQLRVAEHSLDGALVPEDDEKAATGTLASDPAPPLTLSIEDDENSVEETMAAQSQPIASLNRFGMGSRRFNLEEDDEMDEIERLLLDQSATSLQKRQQRSGRSSTMDDEDEFGESSLQSRGDESDEFSGNSSSREENELEGVSTRQWDSAFAVRSTRSNEARQQQAELSRESHTDDIEFGKDSLRLRAHHGEEGETLIRSRSHEEEKFEEASIGSRDGEPVEVANTSRLHGEGGWNLRETNELSQALSSLRGEHELADRMKMTTTLARCRSRSRKKSQQLLLHRHAY
ncbi:uncharacterized protein PITG_16058 [Phytophthora infestans T30-4]|uniref:Uncharacterized protein n=1 Tax=Phytophthora infestans (strain T30-4) TaxID=403677 RepID=D0NSS1_PHYIT|nr:uncharacterized protein PITG_16058 [Phytophthora infestans T30-4]EEY64633.1 conserved hypothetical protein [Phytophthora infestans T30-4]|eukprot:XP_002897833.1 conserved hypothetical protein [Phytophthora infestans T30-4]